METNIKPITILPGFYDQTAYIGEWRIINLSCLQPIMSLSLHGQSKAVIKKHRRREYAVDLYNYADRYDCLIL